LTEEARQLDHQQHSILELREREGLFRYVTQRQLDLGPASRTRIFPSKPMLKQTHIWQPPKWDGTRTYDVTAQISGLPVRIAGDGAMTPLGTGGTRFSLNLTVEATGRLPSRMPEALIAESLSRTIEAEHDFRVSYLERPAQGAF
jgi:hypothetical protein